MSSSYLRRWARLQKWGHWLGPMHPMRPPLALDILLHSSRIIDMSTNTSTYELAAGSWSITPNMVPPHASASCQPSTARKSRADDGGKQHTHPAYRVCDSCHSHGQACLRLDHLEGMKFKAGSPKGFVEGAEGGRLARGRVGPTLWGKRVMGVAPERRQGLVTRQAQGVPPPCGVAQAAPARPLLGC